MSIKYLTLKTNYLASHIIISQNFIFYKVVNICIAFKTPSFPYSYVSPPCKNAIYGFLIGPSHDSSIDDPCTKLPLAIIILSSYPGISYGVGIAVESIAEPFCIP